MFMFKPEHAHSENSQQHEDSKKMLFPTLFVGVRCGKLSMFDRKNTILGSKHTCLAVRFPILCEKMSVLQN